jgi:hypothetical protein
VIPITTGSLISRSAMPVGQIRTQLIPDSQSKPEVWQSGLDPKSGYWYSLAPANKRSEAEAESSCADYARSAYQVFRAATGGSY